MCDGAGTAGGGIGFVGLLGILFIALKLTGYIHWSWWWVLAPIWISWAAAIVVFVAILTVAVIFS